MKKFAIWIFLPGVCFSFSFAEYIPKINEFTQQDNGYLQFENVILNNNKILALKQEEPIILIFSYSPKKEDDFLTFSAKLETVGQDSVITLNRFSSIESFTDSEKILIPTVPGVFIYKNPKNKFEKEVYARFEKEIPSAKKLHIYGEEVYFLLNRRLGDLKIELYQENKFASPISARYYISSSYGVRKDPFGGERTHFHKGIDMASYLGTAVLASNVGEVVTVSRNKVLGNFIIIKHKNDILTIYGHLLDNSIRVKPGDRVSKLQMIAQVGSTGLSTGPHLHFEVKMHGVNVNPKDFLKSSKSNFE